MLLTPLVSETVRKNISGGQKKLYNPLQSTYYATMVKLARTTTIIPLDALTLLMAIVSLTINLSIAWELMVS